LFPYTTLFRSRELLSGEEGEGAGVVLMGRSRPSVLSDAAAGVHRGRRADYRVAGVRSARARLGCVAAAVRRGPRRERRLLDPAGDARGVRFHGARGPRSRAAAVVLDGAARDRVRRVPLGSRADHSTEAWWLNGQ